MVKNKFKYIASVFLMIVIAFTFIFSTLLRVISRDTSKAAAAAQVSNLDQLKTAINGEEGIIEIENDIDIPCEHIDLLAGTGNVKTAQISIGRSVTIKSIGSGTKTLKRTSVDSEYSSLVSMFEIIGDGITVNFENIILDGGATLPDSVSGRIDFSGSDSICGRALIDVLKNSTLNIGNNCTIQNSFNNSDVSAHGYSNSSTLCGGAIRTDYYSDGSVNLSGGTINLLNGSEIKNCSTKAKNVYNGSPTILKSYGGAVAAYNSGTINMEAGATIKNCTSSNGGAIALCKGTSTASTGTLNLSGGTIENCYAIKGGAINVGENSDETPRLNLTGAGNTSFSNCHSLEGGSVLYVGSRNKIQLAENQDNTGNIQISSCQGSSAKGSDGNTVPTKYLGYKNQIEFSGATENSSYFEKCCVTNSTGNTQNNNPQPDVSTNSTVAYEVSTGEELVNKVNNAKDGDIIKLVNDIDIGTAQIILPSDCFVTIDLNNKLLTLYKDQDKKQITVKESSGLLIKNGSMSRFDTDENESLGTVIFYNVAINGSAKLGKMTVWLLQNTTVKNCMSNISLNQTYNSGETESGARLVGGAPNTTLYPNGFVPDTQDYYPGTSMMHQWSSDYAYNSGEDSVLAIVGSKDTWMPCITLNGALNKLDGETYKSVVLLKDYTLESESVLSAPNTCFELQGNTITQTEENKLRIRNEEGTVNLRNGTLVGNLDMGANGPQADNTYIYGNVELNDMTINGNIYNDGHPISITSGNYSGLSLIRTSTNNISGGAFSGDIALYDGATLNITDGYFGGSITTDTSGGTVNITGGKFVNAVGSLLASPYAQKSISEEYGGKTYNYEVIKNPSHENWTYSTENNNTLKAHCGTCDFSVSLQLNAPTSKNYDGNAIAAASFDVTESANWTAAGLPLPEITYEGTGTTSYSSSATPPTDAGSYVAKISATGADNATKTVEVSININKATPTLDLFDISGLEHTYDGSGKSVIVNEKGGKTEFTNKVTTEYFYTKDGKEDWHAEAPANAGEYLVRLVITGADNYSDANIELGASNKLKINKAIGQLPNVDAISATYGQNLKDLTLPTSNSGTFAWVDENTKLTTVFNGQTFSATFTPNDTDNYDWSGAGIDANGNIAVSLTVNVSKANLTKEMFTLNSTEGIYDGNGKTLNLSVPEGLSSYSLEYSSDNGITWSANLPKNAGTYKIKVKSDNDTNYNDSEGIVLDSSFTVNKATGQLPTVDAISATYGQTLKDLNLPGSDSGTFAWEDKEIKPETAGNNQEFNATFTPNDTDNYDWSAVGIDTDGKIAVSLTVDVSKATLKKEMFTLNSAEGIFDGNGKTLNLSVPEGLSSYSLEYSSDDGATWPTNLPKNAGTYKIKVKSENDTNYNDAEIVLDDTYTITLNIDDDGYITDEHGLLKYKHLGNSVYRIKGLINGEWEQVTESEGGFIARTWPKITREGGIRITAEPRFVAGGKGILLQYNLENTTGDPINNFRFFVAGDTAVNGDDKNENIIDEEGTAILHSGDVSFFAFSPSQGCTAIPAYGYNNEAGTVSYARVVDNADPSTTTICKENNADSAIVCYYPLVSLASGQSLNYNICFGGSESSTVKEAIQKIKDDLGIVNVKFKNNKGDTIGYTNVQKGTKVEELIEPSVPSPGMSFDGWYDDINLTTQKDNSFEINENTTIYVKWIKGTPIADYFNFSPPEDQTYDGNNKTCSVSPNSNVHGMGEVTVHYFKNAERTEEITPDKVKDAGTYYVGITVAEGDNYTEQSTVIYDNSWNFEISKATPTANDFTFTPRTNLVYNGSAQTSLGTVAAAVDGIGTATLHYYSDASRASDKEISASNIVNAGAYYVGITVEEGDNYTAQSTVIYDNSWNFEISKATPIANDFTFTSPTGLVYNGSAQTRLGTVATANKVNGIGSATLHYYSDASRASDKEISASNIVNAGTYYVGITVAEGDNYTEQSTVIYDNSWKFEISKATPKASDFTFTSPTGLVYNGSTQTNLGTVTAADGVNGIGSATLHYYSDASRASDKEISASNIVNAGTYYVGITVSEGDNYTAQNTVIYDNSWTFEISKKAPIANDFTFTPPNDSGYDGNVKEATVTPASGVVGMGDTTVRYYSNEARTNEIDADEVKNAGTYYVGVVTLEGDNYLAPSEVLTDGNWKFTIDKNIPDPVDFAFKPPENLVYDGRVKTATIAPASGVVGMGDITVRYYSDEARSNEIDADEVKNAGTYYVGVVTLEGDNYLAPSEVLTDENWKFTIDKAIPAPEHFTFTPPTNLVYNGSAQTSLGTVAAVDGVNGIGTATLHYYSDASRASDKEISASNIVNAGTYYVGITVAEGPNYLATGENVVLLKENWNFTVSKAEPILDFNIISGGPTGQDPQLQTENIPEFSYGKTLEDYKDSLPKSESGTWNFKDTTKELKPAGTQYIELVFTPSDTDNFDWTKIPGYDPKTKTVTVKLLVDVVAEKETWGVPINNNGVVNYESSDGSTSAEITGNDVYWVKETSYDSDLGRNTSSWYGVDNSKGVFEKGSRLLIRWINKEENPEEWNEYLPMIDSQEAQNIPDRKRWIFIAEVIHPDGVTRYEKLDQSVPLYIQKGEDWDTEEGVEAYFISQGADERLNKEYIDNMAYPGGNGGFFKLDLLHFSPYTIYDADPVSSSQNNNGSEKDGNQNKDGEDSQNKSNQENTKNGVNPWYMVAGVGLLGMSLLIGFLIYKKRKKEKDAVMYSILAQIGRSSTSN